MLAENTCQVCGIQYDVVEDSPEGSDEKCSACLQRARENEAFYDAEIAPALLALRDKCHGRDMPFLALVEWSPNEAGRTAHVPPNPSASVRMTHYAMKCMGNLDLLCMTAAREIKAEGLSHNSIVLSNFGAPPAGKPVTP